MIKFSQIESQIIQKFMDDVYKAAGTKLKPSEVKIDLNAKQYAKELFTNVETIEDKLQRILELDIISIAKIEEEKSYDSGQTINYVNKYRLGKRANMLKKDKQCFYLY